MKFIHQEEFDSDLLSCKDVKYLKNPQISAVFSEVECNAPKASNISKRDLVSYLWELKDQGLIG